MFSVDRRIMIKIVIKIMIKNNYQNGVIKITL